MTTDGLSHQRGLISSMTSTETLQDMMLPKQQRRSAVVRVSLAGVTTGGVGGGPDAGWNLKQNLCLLDAHG